MSAAREVVVVSAVRTAIGTFGGTLKDTPPTVLAATVVREAVKRAGVEAATLGHLGVVRVVNTEPRDGYVARLAAIDGGLDLHTPCLTVNRLCGSGLQAIISAAQHILLGDTDVALAGGAENMSRGPFNIPGARFGLRMGDSQVVDMMVGALTDPFNRYHMGMTAENVADKFSITREMQDQLAYDSHQRAAKAIAEGRFDAQITPIVLKGKKGDTEFKVDEHVRADATLDKMRGMKPVFKKDGTVTAGNASGINDGAAALVLMDAAAAEKKGLKPMARLVGYAHAGVEPELMGIGPIPATQRVLARTGIKADQLDVIEANEAFAAQALAVAKGLDLDPARLNVNGSGISLGHPIGATGAIITTKAIYELQRSGGRYALVTMCIGGGQGIAAIFERL
ncbi:acetyl-CoA C-acyltransferase family protein [soil metagenome]